MARRPSRRLLQPAAGRTSRPPPAPGVARRPRGHADGPTPAEVLPRGAYGQPAVLRVPARIRAWALRALAPGRLSPEAAAGLLSFDAETLAREFERPGVE